jgi:glucan endo-1,3-alpha-glucosidase
MRKCYCTCIIAVILLLAFNVPTGAEDGKPLVFAHWILDMPYEDGEESFTTNKNDVHAAMELGIDGFALNAFSGEQAKNYFQAFIGAADAVDAKNFKVFLSADMTLGFTPQDIIETIKTFGSNPHYLKVNGKPLLSTYGGGSLGDQWWQDNVLSPLKVSGNPVTFIPFFDRPNPNRDAPNDRNWTKVIENHDSIDGLFNFGIAKSPPFPSKDENIGNHWWSLLEGQESLARSLKLKGKLYIASYAPYYWAVCHSARQYIEAQGGRGMENAWSSIVTKQRPSIVEIVTWNDYSESTFIQPTRVPLTKTAGIPSLPHLGHYELLKYYVSWYKSGHKPTIVKDSVFFFHRTHPNNALASDETSGCSMGAIPPHQKWGNVQDKLYITTALTAPGQLVVRMGRSEHKRYLPAGLTTIDIPFEPGTPTYQLWRAEKRELSFAGEPIVGNPGVYNFNVASGYAIAAGQNSQTWLPSDRWKTGFVAEWFRPN